MDRFVDKANEIGRSDIVDELGTAWQAYSDNPNSGKAAADMGVAMVMARHDLFPKKCLQNRICPNCMFEQPKVLLVMSTMQGKVHQCWYDESVFADPDFIYQGRN